MNERIDLQDATGAQATVLPALGGWLLRYARRVEGHGLVEALRDDEAVVARYPKEMWAGNPILFPVVSYTHRPGAENHYEWAGKQYPLPQHGFARRSPWSVLKQSPSSVTMELTDSDATRAVYPFRFRYELTYRLDEGRLHLEQVIENLSSEPMPFAAGFHPYLRLPLSPSSHRNDCLIRCPRGMRYNPVGFSEAFFTEPFPEQDVPVAQNTSGLLMTGDLASREFALVDTAAGLEVVLNWEGSPAYRFCALWTRTVTENFYCIEPWTALPNTFSRPDDRELILLASGETFRSTLWMDVRKV